MALKNELLHLVPEMRAYARSLTGSADAADDLVQSAIVRALQSAQTFTPGTKLKAWLFTILRNTYRTEARKRSRSTAVDPDTLSNRLKTPPAQIDQLVLKEFQQAFLRIPRAQREALSLTVYHGLSYDEAAAVCGISVGTLKSRLNRGRAALYKALVGDRDALEVARGCGHDARQRRQFDRQKFMHLFGDLPPAGL